MPTYAYKAADARGRKIFGDMDAANLLDLEMRLSKIDLDLITGTQRKQGVRGNNITRRDLIFFCFHLEQALRSGVSLIESLTDLRDSVPQGRFRQIIGSIIESIEGGQTFSQALDAHPQVFNTIFRGLIKAGEESGTLPEILVALVDSIKWQDEMISKTRQLLIYPLMVTLTVLFTVAFLLLFLVPRIGALLQNMGQALPPQTVALLHLSQFTQKYWLWMLIGLIALIGLIVAAVRSSPKARIAWDRAKITVPPIGPVVYKIILARFSNVFALMYSAGIGVLDAIAITSGVVDNKVVKDALSTVHQEISEGRGISDAFARSNLFPSLVVRMFRVGEKTGNLDRALRNVHYFYSRDVNESIEKIQSMISPIMVLVLGGILLAVILAVVGPLYNFIGTIR